MEYTDDYGKPLQAAITLVDNSNGNVVAMVGGLGAKTVDRGWNWATEPRQCGSATKPISDYAPALDDGTITAASAIDDYPVRDLDGYGAWPQELPLRFLRLDHRVDGAGGVSEYLRRAGQ